MGDALALVASEGGAPTDARSATAEVSSAHMTSDRLVRTEMAPDGSIIVYKKGEFRMPNGDLYVGESLNEKRHGRGTYYYANGDVYVGEFHDGIFHGYGVLRKATFRESGRECVGRSYSGQWVNGSRHGKARYQTGFGDYYEGEFRDDTYGGWGVMVWANSDRYEGEWSKGKYEGQGTIVYSNGFTYSGGFSRGLFHGEGVFRYGAGGGSYNGGWQLGLKDGIGKRIFASGAEYEGEYKEGAMHGRGIYKSAMGDVYVGIFKDDKYHGEGTLILCTGDRYQGQFVRGAFSGAGRYEWERGGYYEGEYMALVRTGIRYKVKARDPMAYELDPAFVKALTTPPPEEEGGKKKKKKSKDGTPTAAATPTGFAAAAAAAKAKGGAGAGAASPAAAAKGGAGSGSGADNRAVSPLTQSRQAADAKLAASLGGGGKPSANTRKRQKVHAMIPSEFPAPLVVGSELDKAYLAAGGVADTVLVPLADGKRHGKGVRVWSDGSRYEGEWVSDWQHGFGVYIGAGATGVRYEGMWKEGYRSGRGVESYGNNDGMPYVCPLGNQHDGNGRCFYDGEWHIGYFWGQGTFTCCDGRQYHGNWKKGKRHGHGRWIMLPAALHYAVVRDAEGNILETAQATGEHGAPLRLDDQGRVRVYEGAFVKNKREGMGAITLNNGDVLEGTFINGRLNGVVRLTFAATKRVTYAMYNVGTRHGWITGKQLERLQRRDKEEAEARLKKEKADHAAMLRLQRANMFGVKARQRGMTEVTKKLEGTIAADEAAAEEKRAQQAMKGDGATFAGMAGVRATG